MSRVYEITVALVRPELRLPAPTAYDIACAAARIGNTTAMLAWRVARGCAAATFAHWGQAVVCVQYLLDLVGTRQRAVSA